MFRQSPFGFYAVVLSLTFLIAGDRLLAQEAGVEKTEKNAATENAATENDGDEQKQENPDAKKAEADKQDSKAAEEKKSSDTEAKEAPKSQEEKKEPDQSDKKKAADKKAADKKAADKKAADKKAADKKAADKEKEEKKIQVRVLPLSGNYVDKIQPAVLDPTSLLLGNAPTKQKSFFRLCDYLKEVGKEVAVEYIVFDLSSSLSMNTAQLDEFTRHMDRLKVTGKKTISWLENASNTHLAIAACCDEVYLADFGSVDMPSMAMQSMYYRDAMDLVGVKASVIRAGEFKGAVEPFTDAAMSSHLKKHYLDMLTTINAARVSRIAKGRGLTTAKVRELQKQRFLTPQEALAAGVVDKLAPYGSIRKTIDDSIGKPTEWSTPTSKKKRQMSFFEFMSVMMSGPKSTSSRIKDNTIAVMHLSGAIVDGKSSSSGNIVSGPTVSAIKKLTDDDKIKGVVIRVNSPGGSATASESIRQALKKLADKKPTVVSMGRVAASGGYWVSAIGVPIYAERGTITGSIGVFSMKLSFGSLMRRVGVTLESITLDDSAAAFSIDRPWTDGDVATMKRSIDIVYNRFLKLVGDSRKMPLDQVRPLAGGRVWSGTQAKSAGLIDEIGGLDDCLVVVAKRAKVEDFNVIHRPTGGSGISLLELLGESDGDEISEGLLQNAVQILKRRGFSFDVMRTLIRDGVNRKTGRPTIWLLNPSELSIE